MGSLLPIEQAGLIASHREIEEMLQGVKRLTTEAAVESAAADWREMKDRLGQLMRAMRLATRSLRANHARTETDARKNAEKAKKQKEEKAAAAIKAQKRRHDFNLRKLKTRGDVFDFDDSQASDLFRLQDEFSE
eukprot:15307735-Alexandrium_andersonii.AAC.1